MKNLVPSVGTMVPIQAGDAALSKDDKNWICRITFDDASDSWVIASRFNASSKRWVPVTKHKRLGVLVFFNDKPQPDDTHVRISAIQPTGQGAYGDAVKQAAKLEP
jgi:hypothetical protein